MNNEQISYNPTRLLVITAPGSHILIGFIIYRTKSLVNLYETFSNSQELIKFINRRQINKKSSP